MKLILSPGPRLTCRDWEYDESRGEGVYVERDVTEGASRYLFDTVALDPGITLRDIFLLLEVNPLLQEVYAHDWAKELLAELASENATAIPVIEYDPGGIEYLELYQIWNQDSFSGELQPIHRLGFHGVGFVLREDVVSDGCVDHRAGERIKWGVLFTSPVRILHLPVRLNPEVILCEDNADSVNYGKEIGRMLNPGVTLGQVIKGVLWELSFHGTPASRNEESANLKGLADELHSGEGITHRSADLLAGHKATLVSCFTDTAGYGPGDLYNTLQVVSDRDNAEAVLQEKLGANLRLKPEFSNMTGMELRGYVRANSDFTWD